MIGNLVANAVRHNSPGSEVALESGMRDGQAFFRVANSGPLVPDEVIPSLFEPFTRLEQRVGNGSSAGLGLAIARSVAATHGHHRSGAQPYWWRARRRGDDARPGGAGRLVDRLVRRAPCRAGA